jgi:hypothetical protein
MEVLDATGRIVITKTLFLEKENVSLQNQSSGLYYVKVISENGSIWTNKLVKL